MSLVAIQVNIGAPLCRALERRCTNITSMLIAREDLEINKTDSEVSVPSATICPTMNSSHFLSREIRRFIVRWPEANSTSLGYWSRRVAMSASRTRCFPLLCIFWCDLDDVTSMWVLAWCNCGSCARARYVRPRCTSHTSDTNDVSAVF